MSDPELLASPLAAPCIGGLPSTSVSSRRCDRFDCCSESRRFLVKSRGEGGNSEQLSVLAKIIDSEFIYRGHKVKPLKLYDDFSNCKTDIFETKSLVLIQREDFQVVKAAILNFNPRAIFAWLLAQTRLLFLSIIFLFQGKCNELNINTPLRCPLTLY